PTSAAAPSTTAPQEPKTPSKVTPNEPIPAAVATSKKSNEKDDLSALDTLYEQMFQYRQKASNATGILNLPNKIKNYWSKGKTTPSDEKINLAMRIENLKIVARDPKQLADKFNEIFKSSGIKIKDKKE